LIFQLSKYLAARHNRLDFSIFSEKRFKPVLLTGFFSFPHHRRFVGTACKANVFFRAQAGHELAALPLGRDNIRSIESDLQAWVASFTTRRDRLVSH
jgi:hypothetical protein